MLSGATCLTLEYIPFQNISKFSKSPKVALEQKISKPFLKSQAQARIKPGPQNVKPKPCKKRGLIPSKFKLNF